MQQQHPSYNDRKFLHTYTAGAFLPLTQAFITACLAGLVTAVILWLLNKMDIFRWSLVITVLVLAVQWWWLIRRWVHLTKIETFLNVDLNGDGVIGENVDDENLLREPDAVIRHDEVNAKNGHYKSERLELPIPMSIVKAFAINHLHKNVPISRRKNAQGTFKIMSDDQWRKWQQYMVRRLWIEWRGNEYAMTEAGLKFFEDLLEQTEDTPSPMGEDV